MASVPPVPLTSFHPSFCQGNVPETRVDSEALRKLREADAQTVSLALEALDRDSSAELPPELAGLMERLPASLLPPGLDIPSVLANWKLASTEEAKVLLSSLNVLATFFGDGPNFPPIDTDLDPDSDDGLSSFETGIEGTGAEVGRRDPDSLDQKLALLEMEPAGFVKDDVEPEPPRPSGQAIRDYHLRSVIKRAQFGLMIELSTIPPYLYAMYSIKPLGEHNVRARELIRVILQQEMLHLSLSGNLMAALGGLPRLYDPRVVPQYPGYVLCSQSKVHLEALTPSALERFVRIESPETIDQPTAYLASDYRTIGAFYDDLIERIRHLPDSQFKKSMKRQFDGKDFFNSEILFPITNRITAQRALDIIVEQGEGNLNAEDSHYEVFKNLLSGPPCDVYNVRTDPQTEHYKPRNYPNPRGYIHQLCLSFDAAYCYLLQTIEQVWRTNTPGRLTLLRNIHSIMSSVLTPLAEILVHQELTLKGPDGKFLHAAPCFNYYPMVNGIAAPALSPRQLHQALVEEVKNALAAFPTRRDPNMKTEAINVAKKVSDAADRAAIVAKAAAKDTAQKAADTKKTADAANKAVNPGPDDPRLSTEAKVAATEKAAADAKKVTDAAAASSEASSIFATVEEIRKRTGELQVALEVTGADHNDLAARIGQQALRFADQTVAIAEVARRMGFKADAEAAEREAKAARDAGIQIHRDRQRVIEKATLARLLSYIKGSLAPPPSTTPSA
ncbi:hypothetical protein NP233_g2107 [Leucocoprinus birnbaumii]|uniref:Iminophenyl-pyruvate dimer synthase domain-containing protein n=1 Tax=Leucocoprinus birnbaumii TaxID=56174 RepID=A0AAD5W4X1_9AGAR|nr:hypothetical protein NP233_g2107 [Leucocoprinus birnbaumii]